MHIRPAMSSSSSSRHRRSNPPVSLGMTPAFWGSSPVLTSMKSCKRRPWRAISSATARAIFGRSMVWMASKRVTASFALLDCSDPIRCSSTPGVRSFSAGHLAFASCTRFSPNRRWPASSTGTMCSGPKILVTAIRWTEDGSRLAAAAAAPMRATTLARRAVSGLRSSVMAADQAHEHDVLVAAADERLLALPAFLDKAEVAVEPQGPVVEGGNAQIELVEVERREGVAGNQRQRVLGQPLALSGALADQHAELGVAREPIDAVEIGEAHQRAVGLVLDGQHQARARLVLEHGVDPLALHLLGDGEAVAQNVVADVGIVAPAHGRGAVGGAERAQPRRLALQHGRGQRLLLQSRLG